MDATDELAYYRLALDALPQGVAVFRPDFTLALSNARYRDIFGLTAALCKTGVPYRLHLRHKVGIGQFADAEAARLDLPSMVQRQLDRLETTLDAVMRFEHSNGRQYELTYLFTPDGAFTLSCTECQADQPSSDWFEEMVRYDDVTGLFNRVHFRSLIGASVEGGTPCGTVFVLRIDNRDEISEALTVGMADRLVRGVAERLDDLATGMGTVARLGDVEFGVWLPDLAGEERIRAFAERLIDGMQDAPLRIDANTEVDLSVSVGAAHYPDDSTETNELIQFAEMAMAHSRGEQSRRVAIFHRQLKDDADRNGTIRAELKRAIERQELRAFYQPKVDLRSGRVVGMEALIRWQHPERGLVAPGLFIPVAERSGLIADIGQWMLHEACRQTKQWADEGLPDLKVAVNVSTVQFRRQSVVASVMAALEKSELPPDQLEIEITESVLLNDDDIVIESLAWLKSLGIPIAVDDFGTGYSSLSYLKRFPVDKVKIDASFVRDLDHDQDDAAIAKTVIQLAHSLNMTVVGEGIEKPEHVLFLTEEGCDEGQGYFFGKPLPADEFEALLRSEPDFSVSLSGDKIARLPLRVG